MVANEKPISAVRVSIVISNATGDAGDDNNGGSDQNLSPEVALTSQPSGDGSASALGVLEHVVVDAQIPHPDVFIGLLATLPSQIHNFITTCFCPSLVFCAGIGSSVA